jgi:hypothetical protein
MLSAINVSLLQNIAINHLQHVSGINLSEFFTLSTPTYPTTNENVRMAKAHILCLHHHLINQNL